MLIGCGALAQIAMSFPIGSAATVGLLFAAVVMHKLRRRRVLATRGWRVGFQGRDEICYEELREGHLERFKLYCELQSGKPHRVIQFSSSQFPAWAESRREEIVARIKSELKSLGYEYR
jgi:hypothetical protein